MKIHALFKTILYHPVCLVSRRTASRHDTPSGSRQRLRADSHARCALYRNHQTKTGQGNRRISHRNHAGHVYPGRSGASGILGFSETRLGSRDSDHDSFHRNRHGRNGTGDTEDDTPRYNEKIRLEIKMKEFLVDSVFFGAVISLAAYEGGLLLKKRFRLAICNPLLAATVIVMAVLSLLNVEYQHYQESAKYISFLLTPATVCLAVPLYQQIGLLKKNVKAVACGITAGVLASLVSIFLMARLFSLSHQQYVTLLPKSITTAIGMGISEELGGITTITVAVIIVTGIFGNVTAEFICRVFRIHEPIARGLAIGTASHAIGTAKAMEMGEIEGAMSSLAIAVAGLLTVLGASVFAAFM